MGLGGRPGTTTDFWAGLAGLGRAPGRVAFVGRGGLEGAGVGAGLGREGLVGAARVVELALTSPTTPFTTVSPSFAAVFISAVPSAAASTFALSELPFADLGLGRGGWMAVGLCAGFGGSVSSASSPGSAPAFDASTTRDAGRGGGGLFEGFGAVEPPPPAIPPPPPPPTIEVGRLGRGGFGEPLGEGGPGRGGFGEP